VVGYPAGSGITAQHEIADIAKATRKLTFSGGFLLVEAMGVEPMSEKSSV